MLPYDCGIDDFRNQSLEELDEEELTLKIEIFPFLEEEVVEVDQGGRVIDQEPSEMEEIAFVFLAHQVQEEEVDDIRSQGMLSQRNFVENDRNGVL